VCVCVTMKLKGKVSQKQLVYWLGVNETTCFDLLGGHHQV